MSGLLSTLARPSCRAAPRRGRFARASSGNVSITFALCLVPLVGLVGLGLDYGVAVTDKSKLDNAADAAALAAVATAKAYIAANPSDPNASANAIGKGLSQGATAFAVNAGSLPFAQVPVVQTIASAPPATPNCAAQKACLYLSRSQQTFSATLSYAAATQTNFGRLFNVPQFALAGVAAASANVPSYLDFYLLIDVSGSMGLPATAAGQAQLAAVNFDDYPVYLQGCQFACHFPTYTGYALAQQNGIQLRSGAVNTAVCSLLAQAATPAVPNQYRIGLYPFVTQMATLAALTPSLSALQSTATCNNPTPTAFTQLLDIGSSQLTTGNDPSTGTGSGGTNLGASPNDGNSIFTQMKGTVQVFGDGSSAAAPKPFVFLITDGMENPQHYATYQYGRYNYTGAPSQYLLYLPSLFDGLRAPTAISPAACAALKAAGATVSVLYIPYVPLTFKSDPYNENASANAAVPNLPTNLQQCATPGFFYTANSPADITSALNAMFVQAVQVTHLTQ